MSSQIKNNFFPNKSDDPTQNSNPISTEEKLKDNTIKQTDLKELLQTLIKDNKQMKDEISKLQSQNEENKKIQKDFESKQSIHENYLRKLGKSFEETNKTIDQKINPSQKLDEKLRKRVAENTKQCEDLLIALKSVEKKLVSIKNTDITELHNYCKKLKENLISMSEETEIKNEIILKLGEKISPVEVISKENENKIIFLMDELNKVKSFNSNQSNEENKQVISIQNDKVKGLENEINKLKEEKALFENKLLSNIEELSKNNNENQIISNERLFSNINNRMDILNEKLIDLHKELNEKDKLFFEKNKEIRTELYEKIEKIKNYKIEDTIDEINETSGNNDLLVLKEKVNLLEIEVEKLNSNNNLSDLNKKVEKMEIFNRQLEELDQKTEKFLNEIEILKNSQPNQVNINEVNLINEKLNNQLSNIINDNKSNIETINKRLSNLDTNSSDHSSQLLLINQTISNNSISKTEITDMKKNFNDRLSAIEIKQTNSTQQTPYKKVIDDLQLKINDLEKEYISLNKYSTTLNLHSSQINNLSLEFNKTIESIDDMKTKNNEQITDILHRLNEIVEYFNKKDEINTKSIDDLYSLVKALKSNLPISRNYNEEVNQSSKIKAGTNEVLEINSKSHIESQINVVNDIHNVNQSGNIETTQAEGNVRCFQSGFVSNINPFFINKQPKNSNSNSNKLLKEVFKLKNNTFYDESKIEINSIIKTTKDDINLNYVKSNLPTRSIYETRATKDGKQTGRETVRGFLTEKFKKNQLYLSSNPLSLINLKDELPEYINKYFIFEKNFENVLEVEIDMNEEDHLSVISIEEDTGEKDSMKKIESQINNPYYTPSSNDDLINIGLGASKFKKSEKNLGLNKITENQVSGQEDSFLLQSIEENNDNKYNPYNNYNNDKYSKNQSGKNQIQYNNPFNNNYRDKNLSQLSDNLEVDINTDHLEDNADGDDIINDEIDIIGSEEEF